MAKVIKNILVTWTWGGDNYALKGYKIVVTPSTSKPTDSNPQIVVSTNASSNVNTFTFKNVLLDDGIAYSSWIQAIYEGGDSDWISNTGTVISDDGNATIPSKNYVDPTIQMVIDMGTDGKITPTEKIALKRDWEVIKAEYPQVIAQSQTYFPTPKPTEQTAYETAYSTLNTLLNTTGTNTGVLVNMATNFTLNPTNDLTTKMCNYYVAKVNLQKLITDTAKDLADNAQKTANEIEIGGRNLLKTSDTIAMTSWSNEIANLVTLSYGTDDGNYVKATVTTTGNISVYKFIGSLMSTPLELNKNYTVSADFKTNGSFGSGFYIRNNVTTLPHEVFTKAIPNTNDKWQRISMTFKFTKAFDNILIDLYGSATAGTYVKTRNWKIEEGNRATSWTPAPEDIDNQINDINQSLTDMVSDNKLTPTEKRAIKTLWDAIAIEKPTIIAQAGTYSIPTTNYTTAFSNLGKALNNNVAYSSGTPSYLADLTVTTDITTVTGTTIRQEFTDYYAEKSTLLKNISDTAKNNFDNLSVGGRNIIPHNMVYWEQGGIDSSGVEFFSSTRIRTKGNFYFSVTPSTKYTLSKWTDDYYITVIQYNENKTMIKNVGWTTTYPNTFMTEATTKYVRFAIRNVVDTTNITTNLLNDNKFKLELGDKATDWSMSEEDIIALLQSLNNNTITKVRYIRDWLSGSSANGGNHWVEIKAMKGNANLAKNKPVKSNYILSYPERITDDICDSSSSYSGGVSDDLITNKNMTTWTKSGTEVTVTASQTDPTGGTSAYKIVTTVPSVTGGVTNKGVYFALSGDLTNVTLTGNIWIKADATTDIEIGVNDYQGETNTHFSIGTTWKMISFNQVANSTQSYLAIKLMTTTPVYIYDPSVGKTGMSYQDQYIQIDLGQVYEDIDYLHIWHYFSDSRKYHKTKTEVSTDGITWFTVFDSLINGGEYTETANGHVVVLNQNNTTKNLIKRIEDTEFQVLPNQIYSSVTESDTYLDTLGFLTQESFRTQVKQSSKEIRWTVSQMAVTNLVRNGSFALGTQYWEIDQTMTSSIVTYSDTVLQGQKALKLISTSTTQKFAYQYAIPLKPSTAYVFSYYYYNDMSGTGALSGDAYVLVQKNKTDKSQYSRAITVGALGNTSAKWVKKYISFTTASDEIQCAIRLDNNGASSGGIRFALLMLEEGTTPSDEWSSNEIISTSTAVFSDDGFEVSHTDIDTKTVMSATGFFIVDTKTNENLGSFSGDEAGYTNMRATNIYANNIYTVQTSTVNYYVDGTNGSDNNTGTSSTSKFKTVNYALSKINKILPYGVTATIYIYNTLYENIVVENFIGAGKLKLIFDKSNSCVLNGTIRFYGCTASIDLLGGRSWYQDTTGATISCDGDSVLAYKCTQIDIVGFRFNVPSKIGCYPIAYVYSSGSVSYCDISNVGGTGAVLRVANDSRVYTWANTGHNNANGYYVKDGGMIYCDISGNCNPKPNFAIQNGTIFGTYNGADSPYMPPPAPTVTTKINSWGTTSTQSWRDSGYGWRSDTSNIYQGNWGYGSHRGFMIWSNIGTIRSALANATINSVRLLLTRTGNGGNSASTDIHLWGHGYTSTGGENYQLSTDFGYIGSYAWGESKWVNLPNSVGTQIRDGNINGLALYDGSSNYAIFNASATLEITYTN